MKRGWPWILLSCGLWVFGCNGTTLPDTTGGTTDEGTQTTGTTGTTDTEDQGTDDTSTPTALAISGRIAAPDSGKWAPRSQETNENYTVIAQSDQTGEIYRTTTDEEGDFELDLPESEEGHTFAVAVLGPDGQTVGPVIFGTDGEEGQTGIAPDGPIFLGTIDLPEDPLDQPILPGEDSDALEGLVDGDLFSRLDENGVPVGLASHGKGEDAETDEPAFGHLVDKDRDGLMDLFDADDDGDGTVDDFDEDGMDASIPSDVHVNFFMNLKIDPEWAPTYYGGTVAEIEARLATDTIITFEVMTVSGATRNITAANLLETPGPSYLPNSDKMSDTGSGLVFTNWASLDYAFDESDDRFEAFVRPNDLMNAGDTFTVEIEFDDGTTEQHTRMINYVFKNIPKLVQYGNTSGVRHAFDVSDPNTNGTVTHPIPFDGTQDLVLIYEPPVDETGAYLTGLDYHFEVFYYSAADGEQINDIDYATTWSSPPSDFDRGVYRVAAEDLTLSTSNTYEVTLPKEIFADTVTLNTGDSVDVSHYKIDIAAQAPSGNAAIMLVFVKQ